MSRSLRVSFIGAKPLCRFFSPISLHILQKDRQTRSPVKTMLMRPVIGPATRHNDTKKFKNLNLDCLVQEYCEKPPLFSPVGEWPVNLSRSTTSPADFHSIFTHSIASRLCMCGHCRCSRSCSTGAPPPLSAAPRAPRALKFARTSHHDRSIAWCDVTPPARTLCAAAALWWRQR